MKKINIAILVVSVIFSLFMYPETYTFCKNLTNNVSAVANLNAYTQDTAQQEPAADGKTRVVFMFDDGWESVYQSAYPMFAAYGYTGTIAIIPSLTEDSEYMPLSQIAELYEKGWDVLNHSYSHKNDMYYHCEELLADFNRARNWMNMRYLTRGKDIAILPYGHANPYFISLLIKEGYESIRTSDNIIVLNEDPVHYYPVSSLSLLTDVTADKVEMFLNTAHDNQSTVLLILHKISTHHDQYDMDYDPAQLQGILDYIHAHEDEYEVVPYSDLFS